MADEIKKLEWTMSREPSPEKLEWEMKKIQTEELEWVMDKEEADWTDIGIYKWHASSALPSWTCLPGNLNIAQGQINVGINYTEVRIESISGWWDDNTDPAHTNECFKACLGFITDVDFGDLGYGDSAIADPFAFDFPSAAEAEKAWKGSVIILELGASKIVGWGNNDGQPDNNAGALTFRISAR